MSPCKDEGPLVKDTTTLTEGCDFVILLSNIAELPRRSISKGPFPNDSCSRTNWASSPLSSGSGLDASYRPATAVMGSENGLGSPSSSGTTKDLFGTKVEAKTWQTF
jgi:hypothetical protein